MTNFSGDPFFALPLHERNPFTQGFNLIELSADRHSSTQVDLQLEALNYLDEASREYLGAHKAGVGLALYGALPYIELMQHTSAGQQEVVDSAIPFSDDIGLEDVMGAIEIASISLGKDLSGTTSIAEFTGSPDIDPDLAVQVWSQDASAAVVDKSDPLVQFYGLVRDIRENYDRQCADSLETMYEDVSEIGDAYFARVGGAVVSMCMLDILPDISAQEAALKDSADFIPIGGRGQKLNTFANALGIAAKVKGLTLIGDYKGTPLIVSPTTPVSKAIKEWEANR